MKRLAGIALFIPLALVVGVFAFENRTPLALKLWPLPGFFEMPAAIWLLGAMAAGLLAGMAIGWLSGRGRAGRRPATPDKGAPTAALPGPAD